MKSPRKSQVLVLTLDALKDRFNQSVSTVRVIAIVSPTCPECVNGYRIMRKIFGAFGSADNLNGFVVWLPMLADDDITAANHQSKAWVERCLIHGWDPKRELGNLFGRTLNLHNTAWDVYLLYSAGIKWNEVEHPPLPTYWMHQLPPKSGAPPGLCLDISRFSYEVRNEIESNQK